MTMVTAAAIAAAGAVVGAGIGYMGQQEASQAAGQRSREQVASQERYNQLRDPFSMGGNRQQYVGQLNQLMKGGPASMEQDPMYKWMQEQGQQAVERTGSKSGSTFSGAQMDALQKQQFGTANQYFNQQYDRLAQLSGASQGANITTPAGMSPEDVYNQQMGQTRATAGLVTAGISGIGGIYGAGIGQQGGKEQTYGTGITTGEFISNPNYGK